MEFMIVSFVLLAIVVGLCAVAFSRDRRIPPNLPPGLAGIPVLGYIPWLSGTPYRDFHELRKHHGDIFSVRLGKRWHVVLNSSRIIRKTLIENGAACSGRPFWILNKVIQGKAIANEQPDYHWKTHRSFWFMLFRQLGKDKMHTIIREELECLKMFLAKENGRPFDPTSLIKLTFCNIICRFCFGKRYAAEDPEFHRLQHNADTYMQNLAKASRTLPYFGQGEKVLQDITGGHKGIIDFIKERIEEHKTMRLREKFRTCDDLLDVYFNRTESKDEVDHIGNLPDIKDNNMNRVEDNGVDFRRSISVADEIDEANLPHIVLDIFVGGLETINAAMLWSLLAMARYPDVQSRIQRELEAVVGRHHLPEYNQLNDLPYTKATLMEIYRVGNIIPLAIPHCVTEPVTIDGYNLPVGTRILPNIFGAHMDPVEWIRPEQFEPSRFLNEKGQVRIPQAYMPFSVGKRVCMGESLARKELFLAFTTVLQNFTILPAHNDAVPEFEGVSGTTRSPVAFMMRAVPRVE